MLKIGITGGIGSGKTHICQKFEALGVPVYYADDRAKYLMENNAIVKQKLIQAFGKDIFVKGKLDRKLLSKLVFNNKKALTTLNNIVHPAVQKDTEKWMEEHSHYPYAIKEAALLFETNSYQKLDKTILIHAPEDIRKLRVIQRDKVSIDKVEARIKNQMSDIEKMKNADFIINNDGNRELDRTIEKLNKLFRFSSLA